MRQERKADTALGLMNIVTDTEFSAGLKRYTGTHYMAGQKSDMVDITLEDTVSRTTYHYDDRFGEWRTSTYPAESEFPHTPGSICPDLTDARVAFIGNDTVDGISARKYSYTSDRKIFDWYFWVDSSGWLIKGDSISPPPEERTTTDLYSTFTVTSRGEPINITLPRVDQ